MAPSTMVLFLLLTVLSSYLLQQVSLLNSLQHTLLGSVLDIAPHQKLIQDEVGLLKVKDDVQLTHLGGGEKAELNIVVHSHSTCSPFFLNMAPCLPHDHSSHVEFLSQLYVLSTPRP